MNMGQFNELALLIEQYLPKLLAALPQSPFSFLDGLPRSW